LLMHRISGITAKLFIWFFLFVLIFFSTVFVLYINVHKMMKISENIVNKNHTIASASKKMVEHLLSMEENEKKYFVLKKADYLDNFFSAQNEFEKNLKDILQIEVMVPGSSQTWYQLYDQYLLKALLPNDLSRIEKSKELWISEADINSWLDIISSARLENEKEMEEANTELNRRGVLTVQTGLAGLGVSILAGLFGGMMLSHSMIRPMGELLKGIRSISRDRPIDPIKINSSDELGELASSFNEMAMRLKEEQRMRSDFISMLSHEIRTPLTSIRESINLINEGIMGDVNERQKRFLEIAGFEMGRVSDLLNRIMQVSYLESGALEIQTEVINVSEFVNACVDQMRPTLEGKKITIEIGITPESLEAMGDPKFIQQVFVNLIGNAIKFSPSESKVKISSTYHQNRNFLQFIVADSGPGIPEEEQPYIFNKYYRGKGVRGHMDGTGLGLSISRHIIEAHSGTIWVTSEMGKGSAFWFTLPVFPQHG
jgi:signal transduction histidine kinase